jgi:hypothetical protein
MSARLLRRLETLRMRKDAAFFCGRALWDEQTGQSVSLATHQREMVDLWQTHRRSVSWCPSEFGKSTLLACWLSWRIGNNPALRVGLLSGTAQQSARLVKLVQICMSRPAYQQAFPGAGIDRATVDELSVKSRPSTMKDANVLAGAFDLSSMLGARFDLAACDDIVGRDHTRTASARDAAFQGFAAVTGSRVGPAGEVHVVGTSEHSDDVPHRLARLPGWTSRRFPALDEKGNPTFPQRWDAARVEARRLELGPIGFQRAMMCVPVDEATLVFRPEDLERALELGRSGLYSPFGGRTLIAVDPAWTVTSTSDESGIVGVTVDDAGYRHVFHVEGLRVHHDGLADRVVALAAANRATVYCESNGAGGVIASLIGRRVPCKPLPTTATSKRARIEALSAELASGRWVFRCPLGSPSPELRKLVDELGTFSLDSHTGDRASALLLACEAVRALEQRRKGRQFILNTLTR